MASDDVSNCGSNSTSAGLPSSSSAVAADDLFCDIEMTMKAKLCNLGGKLSWRVIFGLVNRSNYKVEVDALDFWPLDSSSQVTTIEWPRGEVCLNEQPSFICYCATTNSNDCFDSPRLGFSWSYRKSRRTGLGKRPAPESSARSSEEDAKRRAVSNSTAETS